MYELRDVEEGEKETETGRTKGREYLDKPMLKVQSRQIMYEHTV